MSVDLDNVDLPKLFPDLPKLPQDDGPQPICSIAYPILESAGALASTRLRPSQMGALDEAGE